jgi:hypothetical protein
MDRRRHLLAQAGQLRELGRHRVAEILALPLRRKREIGRQEPQYPPRSLVLALIRQLQAVLCVAFKLADKPIHRATPIFVTLRGFGVGVNCPTPTSL